MKQRGTKKLFAARVGECDIFSLVGGHASSEALEIIKASGYQVCLTSGQANEIVMGDNIVKIPRIIGEYKWNELAVNMLLNKNYICNVKDNISRSRW